jgi:lysyl-tRNA synthetase class 2
VTHHEALDMELYLRIAPELYLKRLLVGGMERVFEINRNFRNEGISTRHNPEFTMLELYQAYADYNEIMELTEARIVELARGVEESLQITYNGQEMDLSPPWPRKGFWELMNEKLGLGSHDEEGIREKARELDLEGAEDEHPHYLALTIFEKCIEDDLVGPVFVKDYPTAVCPLAKSSAENPDVAERFELYLAGMECANAYSELNDPQEQEERFLHQVGDEDLQERVDQDFLRALAHGMPPAGGLGIGIDRLVMVLTDCQSIREVILFPLLRPQGQEED